MSTRRPPHRIKAISRAISIAFLIILSSLTTANGLFVNTFSDGSSQVDVAFSAAGSDNSSGLRLPADSIVTSTTVRASGNALNVTVDVGEDGLIDWGFQGPGYGTLGHQSMFSDEAMQWDISINKDKNETKDFILPGTATIDNAKLVIEAKGTANMTWESNRPFTKYEGKNTVEIGFKDKAFLVPELKDLESDGDTDLIVGYQDFSSPSSTDLTYFQSPGPTSNPTHDVNGSFSTISMSQTYGHPTLVDVDTDNDLDFVYGSVDGMIRFYKNDGTVDTPSWTSNTTLFAGIDVGDYSAPNFVDLNGDTKLDMVIGNSNGAFFFFNNTGTAITPVYTEIVNYFSGISVNNYATPYYADLDGDNDPDMISGDGNGNLIMFQNNGTASQPNIEANTTFFDGTWPISFRSSPSVVDADGDGDLDVCVGYADPRLVVWRNQLGDGLPDPWGLLTDFTLGNSTSLSGQASAIELVDLNGDGLEDLVEVTEASLFITHDNTPHPWGVTFNVNQTSFNGYQDPVLNLDPTFADLDNDVDKDMLVGSINGDLTFFRNTGTVDVPLFQKVVSWAPVNGIDVGQYSAPELGDLDGDGLPDLVIGSEAGVLTYYSNTGTANLPVFSLNSSLFGSIDHGAGGRVVPELVDIDGDSDLDLIVTFSTSNGWSTNPELYMNTGDVKAPTFAKNTVLLGTLGYISESMHIGLVDTDQDGDNDIIMGGDPIKRLYHLENRPNYNIRVGVDGKTTDFNGEVSTPIFEVDIKSIVSSALLDAQRTPDQYSNSMSTLSLEMTALKAFSARVSIVIDYSYGALMADLTDVLNGYISDNQDLADQNGFVTVPIEVNSSSAGDVRLFGLNITIDEPPEITEPLTGHAVNEDSKVDHLIDLWTMFQDDNTGDDQLVFTLEAEDTPVSVSLLQDRWIAVDAETGPENDNWNGDIQIRLNATDSMNLTTTTGFFPITITAINDLSVINSTPPKTAIVNQVYDYFVNATDVDGDALVYGLALNPTGMIINSTSGHIRWMPADLDLGPHQVKLTVDDGGGEIINQTYTLNVIPKPAVNHPPVIVSNPLTIAYVGLSYQYEVEATDEDDDVLSYLLPPGKGPSGLKINFTTGVIDWVPTISQVGEHSVTIVVTDNQNDTSQNFTINVEEIDLPPQVTSSPKTTANVGIPYTYTVTATDTDASPLTFRIGEGPAGMTIDPDTGMIEWTPTADNIGTIQVRIEVRDMNNVVDHTFNIVVAHLQPTISITSPQNGQTVSGNVNIVGTSRISSGNIVKVEVKVDGKDWKLAEGTESWTYKLDTSKIADGSHVITVRALSEHTESELKSITINVENGEASFGGALLMLIAALALVIVIVVVVVIMFLRKRKKPDTKEGPVVAPTADDRLAPEGQEEVTEDEMEADLEDMDKEQEGEVSDDEMDQDLAIMQQELGDSEN